MSVRQEVYLIYGTKLDYDKVRKVDDSNSEFYDNVRFPWCGEGAKGRLGILFDGMGGEYCIAGKCIALEDYMGESFDLLPIPDRSEMNDLEVSDWLIEKGLFGLISEDAKPGFNFYLITHCH